jgi:transglutaminase-like putative cysteine protease
MRRASAFCLAVLLLSRAAGAEGVFQSNVFLSAFPVTADRAVPVGQIELRVSTGDKAFGELSARGLGSPRDGRMRVRLGTYPLSRDKTLRRHSECSFLVDCNEPRVEAVVAQVEKDLGPSAGIETLATWVRHFIVKKSYARGFDTASTTAERREGDCTEHAVLLTALARRRGIPARVVTGLVIVEIVGKGTAAFGHAWVEVHDGKRWHPADAALPLEELERNAGGASVRVDYLPIQIVEREDAGFRAGMLRGHNVLEINGVSVPLNGA